MNKLIMMVGIPGRGGPAYEAVLFQRGGSLWKINRQAFYQKYPRTFHLPWSRSKTDDDRILRFAYADFKYSAAKFVRKNHVQTDQHWMAKPVEPNMLKLE
ncbi:hypothetical protein [Brevibacillus gelatini]